MNIHKEACSLILPIFVLSTKNGNTSLDPKDQAVQPQRQALPVQNAVYHGIVSCERLSLFQTVLSLRCVWPLSTPVSRPARLWTVRDVTTTPVHAAMHVVASPVG